MSDRRRRSENIWDDKEGRRASAEIHSNMSSGRSQYWSKSEAHDVIMMHGNFSRSPSRDHLQRNRNGPRDDDIRRDRNRMYSRSNPDGWEKQYSAHPSDESYGPPYRSRDKGAGGNVRMSRERERTRSPRRSRSRSRDGVSRSSRESTRGPRHENDASYPNMRNNSKDFASRGGGNNMTERWSRRTDYKGGSRNNDYRNTQIPCKFFAAGNCNRDYCKFSHDLPEAAAGYDDNRSLGSKNRAWRNDQQPHDDLNAESNLGEMERKKSWNGSVWNDVESGGFSETSRQDHTSHDNNKNTWDSWDDKKKLFDGHALGDASDFHDVGKSHPNLDNKRSSWNGPTSWDDGVSGSGFSNASNPDHKFQESAKESLNDNNAKGGMSAKSGSNVDRNKTKNWGDVESGGFNVISRPDYTSDDNNKNTWDSWDDKKKLFDGHASRDASGFPDVGKSHPNLDNKRSSWNGPTSWDDGASGSGFSNASNPGHKCEESAKESLNDNNARGGMSAKSGSNVDRNETKKWDGPLWDEFSEPVAVKFDDINNNDIRKWDAPGSSNMASHNAEIVVNNSDLNNVVSEDANQQTLISGSDSIQSVHDMNTQSHSYLNGSEQRQMLLSNPYKGPLNGQGQGIYVHTEHQNKEGGNPLKPLEMDVSQPRSVNDVNDTSLTSQLAPQANALPAEISHIGQLPQLYTESNLANAIDYLKSLPDSAYNQDTKAKEEQDSVRNMDVKPSVPMEILSGSVTQQNQTPADPIHGSSKLTEVGVMKKEAVNATDKRVAENGKKEEKNTKPDNAEAHGKVEEGDTGNDEKAMRLFKVSLVEFVKEILKPKWKEGKMSRDVHKTVVKKVVEKVTSTVQGSQIPRTQPKIDQYLTYSKPKITKLAEAYVEKLLKS